MKGDFTRTTFKPEKHYSSVRMQQGRVQLDADWNEESDITAHRIETETIDTIGECGGSIHHGGFRIVSDKAELTPEEQALLLEDFAALTLEQGDFLITPGRYYVDGIVCENEHTVRSSQQPDLPLPLTDHAQSLISDDGFHVVYLHVWQRHITKLEDPDIREVALGGPDSATRVKIVWQVRHMKVGDVADDLKDCSLFGIDWIPPEDPSATGKPRGKLRARADPQATHDNLCIVPPEAGYQRLENQLYRVEIHDASANPDGPTFKWSRENGSIVALLEGIKGDLLMVSDPGKDEVLGFSPGQWVELSDEQHVLHGQPGILVKLKQVQGKELTVESWPGGSALTMADFGKLPTVRRWDMPTTATGAIEVNTASPDYQDLESGVQVKFEGEEFRTGDYWMIPARTVLGDILWPSENDQPAAEEPHGIEHHFCPLALVKFDSTEPSPSIIIIHDCRNKFSSLTEQLRFFYIGGTGQEAMPGKKLGQPLQVGVSNGQWPVAGAKVKFETVPDNNGNMGGTLHANGDSGPTVMVQTDSSGIAACEWNLDVDPDHYSQRAMATLLTPTETLVDGLPSLAFNANLSIASQVAYDPAKCDTLSGITDVQAAIDKLCQREEEGCALVAIPGEGWERIFNQIDENQDAHICFQVGTYQVEETISLENKGNIKITGAGAGTRIIAPRAEAVFRFQNCRSIVVRGIHAESGVTGSKGKTRDLNGTLSFCGCTNVTVDQVSLKCAAGIGRAASCLTVVDTCDSDPDENRTIHPSSVRIRHCQLGIGHRQIGILLVNVLRAHVEDNVLRTYRRPRRLSFARLLQDPRIRATARKLLVSNAHLGAQPPPEGETNVTVSFGGQVVHFKTEKSLAEKWQEVIDGNPPTQVDSDRDLLIHIKKLANRVVLNRGMLGDSRTFKPWYEAIRRQNPAVASQGIVVGGQIARDIRILNNTIVGVLQGIHIGVSHREEIPGEPDLAGTVIVSGNSIGVSLPPMGVRERYGIFVGNCDSLLLEDNYLKVQRFSKTRKLRIDGVRIYGHLGKRMIVRQNHLVDFTVGIYVNPLNDFPTPQWFVADNVASVQAPRKVRQSHNYA